MKSKLQKYTLMTTTTLLFAALLQAQQGAVAGAPAADNSFYNDLLANGMLVLAGLILVATLFALVSVLNTMVKVQQVKIYQEQGLDPYQETVKKPRENLFNKLYDRLTKVVPVEKEEDILFDHEYDGIRELDNSLPPWWVYMFYLSIGFAVVYMGYYHFSDMGMSSAEQYEQEMEQAEERIQAYLARQSSQVDETNVEMIEDEGELAMGKTIFEANCVACHGMMGEGGVGPNLTDEYWIHGGSIKDVFKVVKYGVPEKGMISWKAQLRPKDMHQVSAYIMTLVGTNPPNAKEPQGEKVQAGDPEMSTQQDSTQTQTIGLLQ